MSFSLSYTWTWAIGKIRWKTTQVTDSEHARNRKMIILIEDFNLVWFNTLQMNNIENTVILTWSSHWSHVSPVGRHWLILSISDNFSDEGSNIEGQFDSFHVGNSSFHSIFVGFQLTEPVLQLSNVEVMISFHYLFFNIIQVQFKKRSLLCCCSTGPMHSPDLVINLL